MRVEVPILCISEPSRVAIEESELRAIVMQIGVHETGWPHAGNVLGIKQPHDHCRRLDLREPHRVIGYSGPVVILVKTVMEQIETAATALVGRTDPH